MRGRAHCWVLRERAFTLGLLRQNPSCGGSPRYRLIWSPYRIKVLEFEGFGGLVVAGGWFCPCFENCIVDASIFVLVECVQVF